jgi:hypothetical protein
VAHRDVKPENILVARGGGIKLIDFGLIRDAQGILQLLEGEDPLEDRVFVDELDRRILAGTPEYMAPEQFSDAAARDLSAARTDTWSDVFSIGVILYEILSGRLPFPMRQVPPEEFPRELLAYMRWRTRLGDGDLPSCPDASDGLRSILVKALRVDPRQRHLDARALQSDLRRFLRTGEGVVERDVTRTAAIDLAQVERVLAAREAAGRHGAAGGGAPFWEAETVEVRREVATSGAGAEAEAGPEAGPEAGAGQAPTGPRFVCAETVTDLSPQVAEDDLEGQRTGRHDRGASAAPRRRWIDAATVQDPPRRHGGDPAVPATPEPAAARDEATDLADDGGGDSGAGDGDTATVAGRGPGGQGGSSAPSGGR